MTNLHRSDGKGSITMPFATTQAGRTGPHRFCKKLNNKIGPCIATGAY